MKPATIAVFRVFSVLLVVSAALVLQHYFTVGGSVKQLAYAVSALATSYVFMLAAEYGSKRK